MWRVVLFWSVAMICAAALAGMLFASGARAAAITLTKTGDLAFGSVVAPTVGTGAVTASTLSVCVADNGAIRLGGTCSAATFDVSGDANAAYSIDLPASATLSSGSNTMTINGFVSTPALLSTLSGDGTGSIAVGATLQLPAGQPPGNYGGSFNVTVQYQ